LWQLNTFGQSLSASNIQYGLKTLQLGAWRFYARYGDGDVDLADVWKFFDRDNDGDFDWEDVKKAVGAGDMGILLQQNATRSIDWLDTNGKCIDHIVSDISTLEGAGKGAFARRNLPKNTIITGTPLLHFPNEKWFDMYEYQTCEDGRMVRDITNGPYGQQLLLNYCFGHPSTSLVLCPYGSGANYINHNKTRANVKVRWSQDGVTNHHAEWLQKHPNDFFEDYSTKVAIDYIAIRDISEGEELLLDYGDVWEDKWNQLVRDWEFFDDRYLKKLRFCY